MKRGKRKIPWKEADPSQGCVICGNPEVHIHHVIYGTANRKIADEYGYTIPLCREHHLGKEGIHHNRELVLSWKRIAQELYEEHYGSREDFIKLFGRSYIYE